MNDSVAIKRAVLVLGIFYLAVYLLPLGVRPLFVPDETRYAEIPREILSTGDWVVPHLNGLRYFEKPPLGYWLNAISISIFGENAFAVRLPSALAAGFNALLIYFFARRFLRDPKTAVLSAAVYLSFLGVFFIGTFSTLDSLLACFLSAAMSLYFLAHTESRPGKRTAYLLLFGLFCALAFLTKGFLAFAVVCIVIIPFILWEGRWLELITRGWIPVLSSAVIIVPWALLIHFQEPDYWHYFFWIEHIKRFTADNAQHREPFWYFMMTLPILALPWSTVLPAAMRGLWGSDDQLNVKRYLWLWLLMPFLFFSASRGKLPSYILPCLAPLAILCAHGLMNYLHKPNRKLFQIGTLISSIIFGCLLITLLIDNVFDFGISPYEATERNRWYGLLSALGAASTLSLLAFLSQSSRSKLILFAIIITPVFLAWNVVIPELTLGKKTPGAFLMSHKNDIHSDTLLVTDDTLAHAVAWYYQRDDLYLIGTGELEYGLSYPDAQHRYIEPGTLGGWILEQSRERPILVFYNRKQSDRFDESIPAQARRSEFGSFILWSIPKKI
jgi:4-amino-4-deoxy-L-arabinose transferase